MPYTYRIRIALNVCWFYYSVFDHPSEYNSTWSLSTYGHDFNAISNASEKACKLVTKYRKENPTAKTWYSNIQMLPALLTFFY